MIGKAIDLEVITVKNVTLNCRRHQGSPKGEMG